MKTYEEYKRTKLGRELHNGLCGIVVLVACILLVLAILSGCSRTPRERAIIKHDRLVKKWDLHDTIVRVDTVIQTKTVYLPGKVITDTVFQELTKDCPEPARQEIKKFFRDNCVSLPDTSYYAWDDVKLKIWKQGTGLGVWIQNLRIQNTETIEAPCPELTNWQAFKQIYGYLLGAALFFLIIGFIIGILINVKWIQKHQCT